jgi:hypothetical protein
MLNENNLNHNKDNIRNSVELTSIQSQFHFNTEIHLDEKENEIPKISNSLIIK